VGFFIGYFPSDSLETNRNRKDSTEDAEEALPRRLATVRKAPERFLVPPSGGGLEGGAWSMDWAQGRGVRSPIKPLKMVCGGLKYL